MSPRIPPQEPRRETDWPPQPSRPGTDLQRAGLPGAAARAARAEDAGMRRALRQVARAPSTGVRLVLVGAGFAPITALGIALAEVASLLLLTGLLVGPAVAGAVWVGARHPVWGRRALVGVGAGMLATAAYDLLRLGLVAVGVWADPIPGIGGMLLGGHDAGLRWWAGYAWRYLGDGGAMGAAYVALPSLRVRSGLAFGAAVCLGLLVLLALAPQAQRNFLVLRPVTALGALAGHLVYGGVLGWLAQRWLRPHPDLSRRGRGVLPRPSPHATRPTATPARGGAQAGHNGAVIAAAVAAGVGCATLGLLTLSVAAHPLMAVLLSYAPARGPLTGATTLAVVVWGFGWGSLHLRWAGTRQDILRSLTATLLLVGVGVAGALGCGNCLAPVGEPQ